MRSLVSVVIPTYNRPIMLKRAIDSVLNQTYRPIEVIVVDDNDPGTPARMETRLIMGQYKNNPHIKYIQHPKNLNGSVARNTGIRKAKGEYIALLDDDDEFLPTKIEYQVKRLEGLDNTWGICYTQFVRKVNGVLFDRGIEQREGWLTNEILKENFYINAGSNLLVRKDLADAIGGFNVNFRRRQDLEFLVRLSQISKIACVPQPCLIIHIDDRSNATLSEELYLKVAADYLRFFASYINDLPVTDKRDVIIGQGLGIARFYLMRGEIGSLYKVCKSNNISLPIFARYMMYLVRRRVFKLCYGFKV